MKVPLRFPDLHPRSAAAVLDFELLQEKASALGRLGRALEAALIALASFDEGRSSPLSPQDRQARRLLVRRAAEASWNLSVQREACGLSGSEALMRDYRVPAVVQFAMGSGPDPA